MKRVVFISMLCFPLLVSVVSCSKSTPASSQEPPQTTTLNPIILNLIASNWERNADEVYTSTFLRVLNTPKPAKVSVYVKTPERDLPISNGGVVYMNGHVSAEFKKTDLWLVYRYFGTDGQIPFSNLNIKVVFEE